MKKSDIFDITAGLLQKASRGDFNKLRYKSVYQAVEGYIDAKNTGAKCSNLVKTKEGWPCVVSRNGKNAIIYISEDNGSLSFWEKEI